MKKALLIVLALLCTYAIAQMAAPVFLGVQTAAANCSWSTAAVVSNGMAFCPLNVGTTAAPIPGIAIALNQGPFVQVFPAPPATAGVASFSGRTGSVLPSQNDYSFSQLSGTMSANQLPQTLTCNLSATVSTSSTVTLTSCR